MNTIIDRKGGDDQKDLVLLALDVLQHALVSRRQPFAPYARLGGQDGMRLTSAAFAIILRFSNTVDKFEAFLEAVMDAKDEEGDDFKAIAVSPVLSICEEYQLCLKKWDQAS